MNEFQARQPGAILFILLVLLGSLVLLWEAYRIEGIPSLNGAGIFPILTSGIMVASLFVVLAKEIRSRRGNNSAPGGRWLVDVAPPNIIGYMALCALYVALIDLAGFWIASGGFLLISLFLLYSRNVVRILAIAAGVIAFVYVVFATIFKVYLP